CWSPTTTTARPARSSAWDGDPAEETRARAVASRCRSRPWVEPGAAVWVEPRAAAATRFALPARPGWRPPAELGRHRSIDRGWYWPGDLGWHRSVSAGTGQSGEGAVRRGLPRSSHLSYQHLLEHAEA